MNTSYKFLLSFCAASALLLTSCELYNPSEAIPAYIHIEKFTLTTDYLSEGTNSHKITDAWVYVDDQSIGCFELPVTFPVLFEGVHRIKVIPGIKVNGISSNRGQYPFFEPYEQDIDFQVGKRIILSPNTTYRPSTFFHFMEDFEGVFKIAATSVSDTAIQSISNPPDPNVFEGTYSGIGYVDNTKIFFECSTSDTFNLPHGGTNVFLEFNYKCSQQFTVSIIAYGAGGSSQFPAINVNPSSNWNKMYVYLTPTVSGTSSATGYRIAWGMKNLSGADSAAMLLDNIKLIH